MEFRRAVAAFSGLEHHNHRDVYRAFLWSEFYDRTDIWNIPGGSGIEPGSDRMSPLRDAFIGRSSESPAEAEEYLKKVPMEEDLKRYEITNLLFILVSSSPGSPGYLCLSLLRERSQDSSANPRWVSYPNLWEHNCMSVYSTWIAGARHRSRLEITVTDDGLAEISLPAGVEEITIDQKVIMIKKNGSARWEG